MRISDWSSDVCSSDLKLAWARANAPLAVAENAAFDPFWLVTRHADVMAISRDPQRFANGIRPTVLTNRDGEALARAATPNHDGHLTRSLVQMDAPDHMKYRMLPQKIGRAWCRERLCQYV